MLDITEKLVLIPNLNCELKIKIQSIFDFKFNALSGKGQNRKNSRYFHATIYFSTNTEN